MVDQQHGSLSIRRQCELLNVNRNRLAPSPAKATLDDVALMRLLDELHLNEPTVGTRGMRRRLRRRFGYQIGRDRIRRLMRMMGIQAMYPKPRTSAPGKGHKIYPYLLRHLEVTRPNQVWCSDISYIPLPRGFCYVVAIMDWYSRKVLAWEVSSTMDTAFCVSAWNKAVAYARCTPSIMNTDQGSQFTSAAWVDTVKSDETKISMDGRGRWIDNVFIERLWWSMKYEDVYLKSYASPREVAQGLKKWFEKYNTIRPHSSLNDYTPNEIYTGVELKHAA